MRMVRPGDADMSSRQSGCSTRGGPSRRCLPNICCRVSSGRTSKRRAPRGLFPAKSDFGSECPDPVSEKVYEPFFRRWADRFSRLRILQQGKVHVYLVYIVLMVVLALAWVSSAGMVGYVMSESLVLWAIVIAASSGLPGLFLGRTSMIGQWLTTLLAVLGAGLGLGGCRLVLGDRRQSADRAAVVSFPVPSSAWPWTGCRPSSCCRSS